MFASGLPLAEIVGYEATCLRLIGGFRAQGLVTYHLDITGGLRVD